VIEHLGSGNQPDADTVEDRQRFFAVARFPNVHLKIHGLGEFCRRAKPASDGFPFEVPIPPLLELARAAFGPARMMWGSDYPPVSAREGYSNALRLTMSALEPLADADRASIFGGLAARVFPIR
jgi:L-fuconolactonase